MTELPEASERRRLVRPTFGEVAREEFWIVAKSFFAPVYGTLLVLRQLLRVTQRVDSRDVAKLEAAE